MKKIIYTLTLVATLWNTTIAQVQFQLNYDQEQAQYTVAVVPSVTYTSPQNMTATGQVTLKVPTGEFNPIDIINYQPGMIWEANAISEAPIEERDFDYYSFGVVASGAVKPDYRAGEEMPLFSFKNSQGCVGAICLMNNETDPFLPPNSKNANVGNQLTILGAGGNAYVGNIADGRADCSLFEGTHQESNHPNLNPEDFIIYPNPAVNKINVEFDWVNENESVEVEIYSLQGKLVAKQMQHLIQGHNRFKLDVSKLPIGTYFLEFKGIRTQEFFKVGA